MRGAQYRLTVLRVGTHSQTTYGRRYAMPDHCLSAHHDDEDDRNYYATAIWGRLGMAIEVQQLALARRNEAGSAAPPRRKGKR
jgi:hypothetical protein